MRILIFGDSITYGRVDSLGGWVTRLRKHFDAQGENNNRDFPSIYNQGISGDSAEDILERFDVETNARLEEDNCFVLAVGTNDSSLENGKPRYTEAQFRENFEKIIKKMKVLSLKILIVGLLPVDENLTTPIPWRPTRHYTNKQVLAFDKIVKDVADSNQLPYVPLFDAFKDKLELFPDGLHPGDEGHQIVAELVIPELEKLLK